MKVVHEKLSLSTSGSGDLINITDKIAKILAASGLKIGNLTVFVIGSTAAVTTFEYEPGLMQDVQQLCEKLIPSQLPYQHNETWQDDNGASHLRATLFGPSLTIPFASGKLTLGTWQQVVLAEFDTRPRRRELIVHIIGE
jgi:secondary thiamine-phosphate synthase enzyme